MGNRVLHSKHKKKKKPRQAHAPSPSIPVLVGEEAMGRGVPLSPSTYISQFLQELKISSGGEMGMLSHALPAAPQLHAGTLLSSSPACSVPSHPSSQVSPSQLPPCRSPPSAWAAYLDNPAWNLTWARARAGGARGDPPPVTLLCISPSPMYPGLHGTQALRSLGARRGREARKSFQEIHWGRESTPYPKRPCPEQRRATSLPATT